MCLQRKRKNHFYELNTMKHNWEYKKLGEIASLVVDGDWIESKDQSESGIRLIQTGNVGNGVFKPKNDKPHYITEETFNRLGCTEIFEGDCLVSRLPDPIGRACLIPNMGNRMITAVDCSIIRFDNLYLPQMFVYFSQSSRYADYISNSTKGSTRKRISRKNLETIPIPLPPLPIQQKIVAELDKVCLIIDKKKQQLKELDKLAQAIFYDMFGDPVENEKGWEVKKLEEIVSETCSISYGIVQPGDGVEEGVPIVRPIDMSETFVYRTGLKQTTKEISDSYKRTILKGDEILLCVRGTTGVVALASPELKECNVTRGITPITCNKQNNRCFIYSQLKMNSVQQYIADYTKGIALKQINMSDVRKIPLIVPPLSLQQSFAAKIEAIEKQKELISRSIKETQTLFDERMDYWFD